MCVFVNNKYCYPAHITTKHKVCTKDIELLSLCLRPYHLPRKIHQIRLFLVYIAPSADTQATATLLHEVVSQAETEAPDAANFIMGDFNLCSLKELLPTYQQYVTCPTRDKACLDHCYGNIPDAFYAKALPGLGNSDHNMIKLSPTYVPRLRREKVRKIDVKCWTATATGALQDCLASMDWDVITDRTDNINEAAFAIAGYIQFCEDTIIPKKTIKMFPNNKPWVTPELKQLLNQKKSLFKSGGTAEDKKTIQRKIKNLIKDCKAAYKHKLEGFFSSAPRRAWQGVQTITGYKPKNHLMAVDNELDMANKLNEFYCRFDTHDFKSEQYVINSELRCMECARRPMAISVSVDDVKLFFRRTNPRKASGPDGVSNRILKSCANELAQPFQRLFQWSLDTGVVPSLWKQSLIVPVPKNNRPRELNDVRPVVLSPILYTLYTNACQATSSANTFFKYADDTALAGFLHPDSPSIEGFESKVHGFISWCTDNFLQVNVKKTKEMVIGFSKKGTPRPPSRINGKQIERVSSYKYLGIEIDDRLCFNECAKNKCKKLQQRMFFLRKLRGFRLDCSIL